MAQRNIPSATSTEPPSHQQVQSNEIVPKGLQNFRNACFAIATLQCLFGVSELAERCKEGASLVLSERHNFVTFDTSIQCLMKGKNLVRQVFKEDKDNMYDSVRTDATGPHLGAVMNEIQGAEDAPRVSVFEFLQAFATVAPNGVSMDGETQQDAGEFAIELLNFLREEDEGSANFENSSCLVNKLFGLTTRTHDITTLPELLAETVFAKDVVDCHCELCGVKGPNDQWTQLKKTSKYLIVNAGRIQTTLDENGHTETLKIHTPIMFSSRLDLSPWLSKSQKEKHNGYELFGMVMHRGER
ncbi:Inactive ubiquitin carboxyl-terminal hydrolase 50 [Lecanora helva]